MAMVPQKNSHRSPLRPWRWPSMAFDLTGFVFSALLLLWVASIALSFRHGRTQLWPILFGFCFFQTFNSLIRSFATSLLPRLPPSSLPLFTNTSVSLIHSTIVGISVAGLLAWEWSKRGFTSMYSHEVLFSGIWPGAHTVLCFSCGYFAYDQWDMLRSHLYNPWTPSLLVHHAVLLACFTMALYRTVTINYLILTLVCELHSVFLHLRRVLRMGGLREEKSSFTKLAWAMNWLTFFTSRILMHICITAKLIVDASKFPSGIEWPLAIMGMVGLNVLNVILGFDLYKAFKKESNIWRKEYKKTS